MSGATVMLMDAVVASGSVVSGVYTGADVSGTAPVTADINFLSNGTVTGTAKALAYWFSNYPYTGIGNNYWVRFTQNSGDALTGTLDTWLRISETRTVSLVKGTAGTATASLTIEIAADSGGASVQQTYTGTINITAS